jgi:diacylglycerol kinase family enzyme
MRSEKPHGKPIAFPNEDTTMIQIVVNPGAGNGRALATAEQLQEALRARGWSTRVHAFTDLARLAHWGATCRPSFSHVVCIGGDATMSAAAMAAVRHRVPLVPVPNGFGNLFARTFGHSDDVWAVAAMLEAGEVIWVDAGTLNGEIFLCHESYGLLEEVQQAVEEAAAPPKPKLVRLFSYFQRAARYLLDTPPWSIRVEVDGAVVARRAVLVTVANIHAYGPYLPVTPGASPTDGLLDIFVIPRTTTLGLWSRLLKLLLRLPPRGDEVLLCRGRRVSVTVPGKPKEELRVLPGVLPLLVPPGCLERLNRSEDQSSSADNRIA